MKIILKSAGFILILLFVQSCKNNPDPPVLTTKDATEISFTAATAGGDVISDGGSPIVTRGVCWSTGPGPTVVDSIATEAAGSGTYSCKITGLTPNTTYYLRAFATNVDQAGYGNEITFKTLQNTEPVITTAEVTSIGSVNAVSGGNISSDGGLSIIARGVCWGTGQEPATDGNKTRDGEGSGAFTSSISGLTPGTRYYVRAYAANSLGTSYGAAVSFTTLAPPAVTTGAVTGLKQTSVTAGGEVTSSGGAIVTDRGFCWSTSPDPSIDLSTKTSVGSGNGAFTCLITGLTLNKTYYIRAYATNSIGTSYGSGIMFNTLKENQVADIDNNVYNLTNIGNQVWFRENLKAVRYINGDQISGVTGNSQWQNQVSGAWRYYNDDNQNNTDYGKLYNWQAVNDSRKICPEGWHIPSDAEWKTLESYLGMDLFELNVTDFRGSNANAGGKLKKVDTALWNSPNAGATDETGFSGIPGGYCNMDGTFTGLKSEGAWWSSTAAIPETNLAWLRKLSYSNRGVYRSMPNGQMAGGGFSVRCLKD